MVNKQNILGVILSGGRSRRMGCDKAIVKLGKVTLLEHAVNQLKDAVQSVAISANQPTKIHYALKLTLLPDAEQYLWAGPLSGILAGLYHAKAHEFDYILTLAIDTPFITDIFFDQLLINITSNTSFRLAASQTGLEPTLGIWPITLIENLEYFLSYSEDKSIRSFAFKHGVEIITFDEHFDQEAFININTADELKKACDISVKVKAHKYET